MAGQIEHRRTRPDHPWPDAQLERMNRTIREAIVKRFHDDTQDQRRMHRADFMTAHSFARRLKTLGALTPYE